MSHTHLQNVLHVRVRSAVTAVVICISLCLLITECKRVMNLIHTHPYTDAHETFKFEGSNLQVHMFKV